MCVCVCVCVCDYDDDYDDDDDGDDDYDDDDDGDDDGDDVYKCVLCNTNKYISKESCNGSTLLRIKYTFNTLSLDTTPYPV